MNFKLPARKGQIRMLEHVIIALVVIGFMLIIGLSLMGQVRDTQPEVGVDCRCGTNTTCGTSGTLVYTNCSAAYNASVTTIGAIDDIPDWLGIIVLAFVAVIVLGVISLLRRKEG